LLPALACAADAALDARSYSEHVKYLASGELRGRGTGTPGLEKAADYIARQFKSYGLEPAGGSYFQKFPVTTQARMGSGNQMQVRDGKEKRTLKLNDDFLPFNFSSAGKVAGTLVFAGYGITAPEYNFDDYAGLDVKDKIVLLMRREPQENDEKSVFAGKALTRHAQFDSKASNAKMRGARAVILLTDIGSGAAGIERFGRTAGPANAGIPIIQLRSDFGEEMLAKAGKNLKQIHGEIDKDLKPRSFAFPENVQVDLNVDVRRQVKTVRNVSAFLPGESDEYVVIGAHYDHLGLGEQFSMAPSQIGTPHPGADDNASGTAGVLELARYYAGRPRPKRGILFLCFAGEEFGLLGSGFWVNNPRLPIGKAVAMINMDMIGRIRDGRVFIGGAGTGSTLKQLIADIKPNYPLQLDLSEQAGYGSSDHTSFTTKQVPVLFFFSGLHSDYHKPSDTWDKINSADAVTLLQLVADITDRLSSSDDRPLFVRVAPPAGKVESGAGGGGYGAYFGSVPDFADQPRGVKFADVTPGSPAAKAGLKGGDVLIEFDGKPIQNLSDFSYALRARKPGDEVSVMVLRGSETLSVKVLLTVRK
jgi:hypothetical protein